MSFKRMPRYHLSEILKSQYVHHDNHLCHGNLSYSSEICKFSLNSFVRFPYVSVGPVNSSSGHVL